MDRYDDPELNRDVDATTGTGETHATTGGAAAAGAVTGGVIGLTGGPVGAAIGAVGGAIVGAAAERMMHSEDDSQQMTDIVDDTAVNRHTADRVGTSSTDITSSTTTNREAVFGERDDDTDSKA
jgi:outer membrane lipoprotein SlyB